jgi:hypothetical protein
VPAGWTTKEEHPARRGRRRSTARLAATWASVVASTVGCATFGARGGLGTYAGEGGSAPSAVAVETPDPCVAYLQRTPGFRAVGPRIDRPDVYVELRRKHYLEPSMGAAVLAGLTLFIAPARFQTDTTIIRATVVASANTQRREFTVERRTSRWGGLFLFPFMLFRFPSLEDRRAEETLCADLAYRLRETIDALARPAP